jgi:hypothetical protein
MIINQQQVFSGIRWALSVGGAFAIGRGWVTPDQLSQLSDQLPGAVWGLVAVVPLFWSVFITHTKTGIVAAAKDVIEKTPDLKTAAPVMDALAEAGAIVHPGGMPNEVSK